jgi:hypothetical protein
MKQTGKQEAGRKQSRLCNSRHQITIHLGNGIGRELTGVYIPVTEE